MPSNYVSNRPPVTAKGLFSLCAGCENTRPFTAHGLQCHSWHPALFAEIHNADAVVASCGGAIFFRTQSVTSTAALRFCKKRNTFQWMHNKQTPLASHCCVSPVCLRLALPSPQPMTVGEIGVECLQRITGLGGPTSTNRNLGRTISFRCMELQLLFEFSKIMLPHVCSFL